MTNVPQIPPPSFDISLLTHSGDDMLIDNSISRSPAENKNLSKYQMSQRQTLDNDLKKEFLGKKQFNTFLKKPGKKYGIDLQEYLRPTDSKLVVNQILRQISDLKMLCALQHNKEDLHRSLLQYKAQRENPFLFELKERAPILRDRFALQRNQTSERRRALGNALDIVLQKQGKPFMLHSTFRGNGPSTAAVWQQYRSAPLLDAKYNYNPNEIPPFELWNVPLLQTNEAWATNIFHSMELQMIRRMRTRLLQGPYKVFGKAMIQLRKPDETMDVEESGHQIRIFNQFIVFTKTPEVISRDRHGRETGRQEARQSLQVQNDVDIIKIVKTMREKFIGEVYAIGEMYIGVEALKAYYIQIEFAAYRPLAGAAYVELPAALQAKKCIINVQNKDNRCFEYSLLAALHHEEIQTYFQRPAKYEQWLGSINLGGASLPITVNAQVYKKIEKLNQLSICVYGFLDEEIAASAIAEEFLKLLIPLYVTDNPGDAIILLYYKGHYSWVKDWQRFTNESGRHLHHCQRCMCSFKSKENLEKHMTTCVRHEAMQVTMPKPNSEVKFEAWHKTVRHPVAIYADFEALNVSAAQGPKDSVSSQPAASFGIYIESDSPLSIPKFHSYVGEDCCQQFVKVLRMIEFTVRHEVFIDKEMLPLTTEEQQDFDSSTHCQHCKVEFGAQRWSSKDECMKPITKCRDHSHQTGKYRIALCDKCNLRLGIKEQQGNKFIPVFFHNLKGYDMTHVLACLTQEDLTGEKLNVIPQNGVKFTTFSWTPRSEGGQSPLQIRFLDSFAFLTSSLDTLIKNLPDEDKTRMRTLCAPKVDSAQNTIWLRFGGKMLLAMPKDVHQKKIFSNW